MKKIAVLIAAGSGMGADAAKTLAKNGFKIAIMSSSGKGEKLAKKLRATKRVIGHYKMLMLFQRSKIDMHKYRLTQSAKI